MHDKHIIDVVGAIIKDGDRYLVGQRAANKAQGGLWEVMGGKIEPGETPEQALARECREELALEIERSLNGPDNGIFPGRRILWKLCSTVICTVSNCHLH